MHHCGAETIQKRGRYNTFVPEGGWGGGVGGMVGGFHASLVAYFDLA